ncbi:MAG TPA: amino acid racemase [Vicinamibacterales bacterium]|nr:amino acid racemase [Vicinamibacterales bacterium]
MKANDRKEAAPLHIGILAHSADGAALCFVEAVREASRHLGPHQHPEITLSILPMGPALDDYEKGDLDAVRKHLARTARRLADAGCDFFVCPDNTAHIALELGGEPLPLPGLHIAAIVAERARGAGRRCVGLLGTKWTMEGPVYPAAFARCGINLLTPAPADRALLDRLIFDELCQGRLTDAARSEYLRVIAALREAGCDAVALCCTEIPLLITPDISPLPTLDSTRLLAHAAVEVALRGTVPHWRGGPL